MSEHDYLSERYSLCIVNIGDGNTPYKYYRIADYDPADNPDELVPAITRTDVKKWSNPSTTDFNAHPSTLCNTRADNNYEKRGSDFFLLKWRISPEDETKQLTKSAFDDAGLLKYKDPHEVIMPEGVNSDVDLQRVLTSGFPFSGRTTKEFYIVYEKLGGSCHAAKCKRDDFESSKGLMRLKSSISEPRKTVLSLPMVCLDSADIIESPHDATGHRMVYANLADLESERTILLRPIDYYAADYVKWFAKEQSSPIPKADRPRLAAIINQALSDKDELEVYLGAEAPVKEVRQLMDAVARAAGQSDDQTKQFITRALLEDERFRAECIEQAKSDYAKEIKKEKEELDKTKAERKSAEEETKKVREELDTLKVEKEELGNAIESLASSVIQLPENNGQEQTTSLSEASCSNAVGLEVKGSRLLIVEGAPVGTPTIVQSLHDALPENMKAMGLLAIKGNSDKARRDAARSVSSALTQTPFLAIPFGVAGPIADAVSISLFGKTATRFHVPTDSRDYTNVLGAVSHDGVVIVENVFDSVNEGMLFALLESVNPPIMVFPFGSFESVRLLAEGFWSKVFFPYVGTLVHFPGARKGKFKKSNAPLYSKPCNVDALAEYASSMMEDFADLALPATSLLLPAAICGACDGTDWEEEARRLIVTHLLVASRGETDAADTIAEWSGDSGAVSELLKQMGMHVQ